MQKLIESIYEVLESFLQLPGATEDNTDYKGDGFHIYSGEDGSGFDPFIKIDMGEKGSFLIEERSQEEELNPVTFEWETIDRKGYWWNDFHEEPHCKPEINPFELKMWLDKWFVKEKRRVIK